MNMFIQSSMLVVYIYVDIHYFQGPTTHELRARERTKHVSKLNKADHERMDDGAATLSKLT